MLKLSETLERLHNEGRECPERKKDIENGEHCLIIHGPNQLHQSSRDGTVRDPFVPARFGCKCVRYYLGQVAGVSGEDEAALARAYSTSEDMIYEIEHRYEGSAAYPPHTFGQLAEWARGKGL